MRRRTGVLLAIIVILISFGTFIYVQRIGLIAPVGSLGLSGTDFLGTWLNAGILTHNPTTIIGGLVISENQGTYTVTVVAYGAVVGTNILTVNPPNAHAFVTMNNPGIISADLTLQLLNSTFMQAKESVDYVSNLSTTLVLATEQFIKWSGSFSTQSTASQATEQMVMEGYSFPSGGPLTVALRNVGSASENLAGADYFVNGVLATSISIASCSSSAVTTGAVCSVTLTVSTTSLILGAAYPFKIVTPTGGVFSYAVIYGGQA
jgi:hypothetical protein